MLRSKLEKAAELSAQEKSRNVLPSAASVGQLVPQYMVSPAPWTKLTENSVERNTKLKPSPAQVDIGSIGKRATSVPASPVVAITLVLKNTLLASTAILLKSNTSVAGRPNRPGVIL